MSKEALRFIILYCIFIITALIVLIVLFSQERTDPSYKQQIEEEIPKLGGRGFYDTTKTDTMKRGD